MSRSDALSVLPKSFKVLDHTVRIKKLPGLVEKAGAFGLWDAVNLTIYIDPSVQQSVLAHTLWHEITHAILDLTGDGELSKDERLVDSIGGALAQVVRTLK